MSNIPEGLTSGLQLRPHPAFPTVEKRSKIEANRSGNSTRVTER
jgi:hypothetical protein